jgi:hypothetical protein
MFDPRSVQECRAPSLSVQSSAIIVWLMFSPEGGA